jgi:uncharacterized membrane protein YphA (DoxX/SURF4 family)
MSLIQAKARVLIGAAAIADGVSVLRNTQVHEEVAATVLEPLAKLTSKTITPKAAVRTSGIGLVAGGGLIATSIAPRLGALAALTATVPPAVVGYQFWKVKDDPAKRERLEAGFWFYAVLIGASLLILASPSARTRRRQAKAAKASR